MNRLEDPVVFEPPLIAAGLTKLTLSDRSLADLECIATGIYSPLEGFVTEEEYNSIVHDMRLPSGVAWPIPITLQVSEAEAAKCSIDTQIALTDRLHDVLAVMIVTSKYRPNQELEARKVYNTLDTRHPGVRTLFKAGPVYLGGPVSVLRDLPKTAVQCRNHTPDQARAEFVRRGWRTICAFQTRNPMHRAHEYLTKVALENNDGLFLSPLVGETNADDIPASVRMECYEVLLANYYPKERVVLSAYPAAMRYAGPREAVLHAISRQNYGCSHIIIGRDHAGIGNYYGSYDAQEIFNEFSWAELSITPLKFEHAFYCRQCATYGSRRSCPHTSPNHVHLSGTKLRQLLSRGEMPPAEFSRPEVARILMQVYRPHGAAAD